MHALPVLTAVLLGTNAAAQILPGPEPPPVEWEQTLGAELPLDARFVGHQGRAVALRDCLGERPVVLALVYYECPMLCGLVLEGLVKGLRAVDFTTGQDFDVLVISIDPQESSALAAAKRASVLASYGLDAGAPAAAAWRFLVGAEPDIRAVADAVGFRYSYVPERDEWAHPGGIAILTPAGALSRVLFGVEFAPRDLRLALVEAAEGEIGTTIDQVLLRCFHYDPARGKYGFAVLSAVRWLGALTVGVLGAFVFGWLRRERKKAGLEPGEPRAGLEPGEPGARLEPGVPAKLEPGVPR